MPILAAISGMGLSFARRAIRDRSEISSLPTSYSFIAARQHVLAPPLRRFDLVEREDVESGDLALGQGKLRHETRREAAGS